MKTHDCTKDGHYWVEFNPSFSPKEGKIIFLAWSHDKGRMCPICKNVEYSKETWVSA